MIYLSESRAHVALADFFSKVSALNIIKPKKNSSKFLSPSFMFCIIQSKILYQQIKKGNALAVISRHLLVVFFFATYIAIGQHLLKLDSEKTMFLRKRNTDKVSIDIH